MITYYIEQDGQIKLHDTDKSRIEKMLNKYLPQYKGLEIKETERPIEKGEWADTPEYKEKKALRDLKVQVDGLEVSTGLIRPIREMVLAENSGASDYIKSKAQEIETLAEQLRK